MNTARTHILHLITLSEQYLSAQSHSVQVLATQLLLAPTRLQSQIYFYVFVTYSLR